jgi:superfamily I DNA/RNA helicase
MPELMQKAATCFVSGKVAEIDYNDMCWLPMVLNLRLPRAGLVLCDESQDLNQVQQWMAIRAGEKLAIVGDRNQAIYGFRGADNHSMDNLAAKAGKLAGKEVVEFPLSYTRRCPHSHVRLAQVVVPGIHALPGAVDGVTGIRTLKAVVSDAGPGEMIICRSNAPLITVAHRLLAEGVRAVIKGKDVGAAILRLLDQSEKGATLAQAIADAQDYTYRQVTRFTLMDGDKGRMRAQIAEDRLACLEAAAEGCGTVKQLRDKLKMLFSDEEGDGSQVVTLSTIHKAKGLESVKVTVLSPHLLPHPYASRARELEQEMNCLYVALTRSKHELYFVDQLPPPLQDAGIRL